LLSEHKNRLVLGGPGTGKTYLFRNIIEMLPESSNVLVITFINTLVDDLEKQLSEISNREIKVRTLHGFSKNFLLQKIHPYEYFPELPKIIEDDASILELGYKEKDANRALANLKKEGEEINFYLSRSKYYNSASHDDAVYRVFFYLYKNNDAIPQFSQVIIDEYQDFNLLEANLIALLTRKNSILIAGDDDQALYRFKYASPAYIRRLYSEEKFTPFFLPFCRRCPSILIRATNSFIFNAKRRGLLNNRIKKEFKCYWPDKFVDSKKYPLIFLGKFSTNSVVSKFIKEKIMSIIKDEGIQPSDKKEAEFLILGPPRMPHYLKNVYTSLVEDSRFDQDIFEIEHKRDSKRLSISEGYEFIRKDVESNLGWRIVILKNPLDSSLKKDKEIINKSLEGKSIIDLLPEEYVKKHKEKIKELPSEETKDSQDSLTKKIKIKLITYLGAKGLSANHVFVLGLENKILPKNPDNISDDEICQFIVLLTRARKSLDLLVSKTFDRRLRRLVDRISSFVSMIPRQFFRIEDNIKATDYKSRI
jgi:superfamily I DNA/RNA helicase